MIQLLTSLDVGAKFDSQLREFTYDVQGKKTLPVTDNGLLSVDLKGGYNYNPGSKKVCNHTVLCVLNRNKSKSRNKNLQEVSS